MNARRSWCARAILALVLSIIGAGGFARAAGAHPLGNLSVNHFHGLVVSADRLVDDAVVDIAEIPTAQAARLVDADGDGTASDTELAAYGQGQCESLRTAVTVTADGTSLAVVATSTSFVYRPGQAGLPTSRLECRLEAALDASVARTLVVADSYLADRVGWHEITATADGITLVDSPIPSESTTERLDHYPTDPLNSPLAVRRVTLHVVPGAGHAFAAAPKAARHGVNIPPQTLVANRGTIARAQARTRQPG